MSIRSGVGARVEANLDANLERLRASSVCITVCELEYMPGSTVFSDLGAVQFSELFTEDWVRIMKRCRTGDEARIM